jgi:hypothetical protein
MDKGGFLDTEVLMSVGFWILFGLAFIATMVGFIVSKSWGMVSIPIWQLIVIIIAEFFGAYYFASR